MARKSKKKDADEIEREERDNLDEISESDLLKPFDALKFGSEDDPCYGKLFDLKASECRMCGDSEHCQIAFMQNSGKVRALQGGSETFLDQEEDQVKVEGNFVDSKKVKRYYRKLKKAGSTRKEALANTAKKFDVDKKTLKLLIPIKKKTK